MKKPPREVVLRSFSFANKLPLKPKFIKEPGYRNTTLGFRTRARCRTPRETV